MERKKTKVVVIYSSLSTCDPGDIHETIAKLKTHKVRASVVGIGAEMVSGEKERQKKYRFSSEGIYYETTVTCVSFSFGYRPHLM